MIERLVVGTKNPDKAEEMQAILDGAGIETVDAEWPDVEETGATLEENARLKARAVSAATGLAALADDTGLEVAVLDGRPGVHTARFAGPESDYAANRAALLEALEGVADRAARFRTVVVVTFPTGRELRAEGTLAGQISTSERGEGGFGYDPIFELPDGRTLAEVPLGEKNTISHRARALAAMIEALQPEGGGGATESN